MKKGRDGCVEGDDNSRPGGKIGNDTVGDEVREGLGDENRRGRS